MPLREYLRRRKKTVKSFAEEVGISRQMMHRFLNGTRIPGAKTARRIVKASNYQITLEDLWHQIDYKEEVYDVL